MDERTEYVLSAEERGILDDLEQEIRNLQQQHTGAVRVILKINKLQGDSWKIENGKLTRQ